MTMSRQIMALAATLGVLGMAAGVPNTAAQEKTRAANIAVVDVEHLMQNAAAAKSARAQVAKMRAGFQLEIKRKMEVITKAFKKVKRARATLSKDAFEKRLAELRKDAAAFQNAALDHHGKLDAVLDRALDKIAVAIERVVERIIKERKFEVVLPRSGVIGRPRVPDVTGEVLERIDRQMPSVAVEVPR